MIKNDDDYDYDDMEWKECAADEDDEDTEWWEYDDVDEEWQEYDDENKDDKNMMKMKNNKDTKIKMKYDKDRVRGTCLIFNDHKHLKFKKL